MKLPNDATGKWSEGTGPASPTLIQSLARSWREYLRRASISKPLSRLHAPTADPHFVSSPMLSVLNCWAKSLMPWRQIAMNIFGFHF